MFALWSAPRRTLLAILVVLLHVQQRVLAQDFDCHVAFDAIKFDLTALAGERVVSRTRETPPSLMLDEVTFNLCQDLTIKPDVPEWDQCTQGTRACMTMTNQKGDQGNRIIAAIPLAISPLKVETTLLNSPDKGLNLVFQGGTYPKTNPLEQSLNLTLYCDTTLSDPTFISYYGMQAKLEWRAPAGCSFEGENPPGAPNGGKEGEGGGGKGGGEEHVGSGIGWFFLLLLLAFVGYFVLGAYHNYSNYGATGADLIPHRDFWREVPYVLRDIGSHLCSALRPSPRNGYIAV